jgi:hypothetical protein
MSTPALAIDQGDDETIDVTVRTKDGALADLDGWALWFYVKRTSVEPDATALLEKTELDGITVLAPTTGGLAEVIIDQEDTDTLPAADTGRQLYYVLKGEGPDGRRVTLAKGRLVINRDLIASD